MNLPNEWDPTSSLSMEPKIPELLIRIWECDKTAADNKGLF